MDIKNLNEALQYLKEHYITAKLHDVPVMHGLSSLNGVILKLQEDLSSSSLEGAKKR